MRDGKGKRMEKAEIDMREVSTSNNRWEKRPEKQDK